jgi:hypothetical protein
MPDISFNCSCTAGAGITDTLVNLRKRMLRRMGYAAQVNNPPPGIADLFNDYLQSAQRQLIEEFTVFKGERYFTWALQDGVRFYDYDVNAEQSGDGACNKVLNTNTITFVGLVMDGVVSRLRAGVPATVLDANSAVGVPTRYGLGQCIELWPVPMGNDMKLVVRGNFGEMAFAQDDDKTTIDSECVWLHAMANAKAHAGHPDAGNYMGMLTSRIGRLVAGTHGDSRYVPAEIAPGGEHLSALFDGEFDMLGDIRVVGESKIRGI